MCRQNQRIGKKLVFAGSVQVKDVKEVEANTGNSLTVSTHLHYEKQILHF